VILRGVAFRSSRVEPFAEEFLRHAIERLLRKDLGGVQQVFLDTVRALRRRELPVAQLAAKVRLSKTPEEYEASGRRELPYEAMLQSGRPRWSRNTIVHVVRKTGGRAAVLDEPHEDADEEGALATGRGEEVRDYDAEYYERLLRTTYAARLATGLGAEQFAAVFADPDQLSLFSPSLHGQEPILTVLEVPAGFGPER
jgi:DNA polymerase elongation subunit (family B)